VLKKRGYSSWGAEACTQTNAPPACRPMAERSKHHNAGFEKNAKNVFALAQ